MSEIQFIFCLLLASAVFIILFLVSENVMTKYKVPMWGLFIAVLLVTIQGLEYLACDFFVFQRCKWLGWLALVPHLIFGLSYKLSHSFRRRIQRAFYFNEIALHVEDRHNGPGNYLKGGGRTSRKG